jgi:hypothetical protein
MGKWRRRETMDGWTEALKKVAEGDAWRARAGGRIR